MIRYSGIDAVQANQLARFVRSHGNPCRVVEGKTGYRLRCALAFSSETYNGFRWQVEEIPATLKAAREWLGY